jgi:hypothetical protein
MSQKEVNLEEYVDQRRWLLNNGLVTDDVKNQLFFCGSIVHKEVQAVELQIDAENRRVDYTIYVDKSLLKRIDKYHVLSKSDSLFGLWRFRRMLRKEGSLDFSEILNRFVKDFCGSRWSATVKTVDFETYIEGLGEQSGPDGTGQQSNKLPD